MAARLVYEECSVIVLPFRQATKRVLAAAGSRGNANVTRATHQLIAVAIVSTANSSVYSRSRCKRYMLLRARMGGTFWEVRRIIMPRVIDAFGPLRQPAHRACKLVVLSIWMPIDVTKRIRHLTTCASVTYAAAP